MVPMTCVARWCLFSVNGVPDDGFYLGNSRMEVIRWLEKSVIYTLLAMMMLTIIVSTVELGVIIYREFMAPPQWFLDIDNMLEIFGFFLMVVIGLELFETIRVYVEDNTIHVEVVLLVAIVAVARKVIIIDYNDIEPMMNFSIAALIITLSCGYYIIKRLLEQIRRTKQVR